MKQILPLIAWLTIFTVVSASCNKEEGDNPEPDPPYQPTYTSEIRSILDSKCAISGCHDGNSGVVGFTSYAPLKERADNGRIRSYVFELKIMPPSSATQLTDDEKKLLQCWLDDGAPEN